MKFKTSLKKMTKRAAALFMAAAVMTASVPQEYMTVFAAEMNETDESSRTNETDDGVQTKASEPEETGPKETEHKETESKEIEPNETESKETEPEKPSSDASEIKETEGPLPTETEPVTPQESSSAMEETESESTKTVEETETEPVTTEVETNTSEDETGTTEEETTEIETTEIETETELDVSFEAGGEGVPAADRTKELASGKGYTADGGTNENVDWFLDTNGVLEITGTGDFYYFDKNDSKITPWANYSADIKYVKISVDNVTTVRRLFKGYKSLLKADLNIGGCKPTSAESMFQNCTSLKNVDLSGLDTSKVTDMSYMFDGCSALESFDTRNFDTGSVTNMNYMFQGCSALKNFDMSNLNTSSVTKMIWMFHSCSSLTNFTFGDLDVSNVTDMFSMFRECSSLVKMDLSGLDTGNVTDMRFMFHKCSSLEELKFNNAKLNSVKDVNYMVCGCTALKEIDLSGFNLEQCSSGELEIFVSDSFHGGDGCKALTSVIGPANLTKTVKLPSRTDISWRRPNGRKETTLVKGNSDPVTVTTNMAGIAFEGKDYSLTDDEEEGSSNSLLGISNEKIMDIGTGKSYTFTLVPDEGYVIKKVELSSGYYSTLILEKGSQPNQYTISPKDKEAGYTRDETVNVETEAIGNHTLTVDYESFAKEIEDIIVLNDAQKLKITDGTVQVSNNADTSLCVKLKASASEKDPKEPVAYQNISFNKEDVPCLTDKENMGEDEKQLYDEGYYIFRIGTLFEDTAAGIEVKFSPQEGDIAGGREGNNTYWVIDKNGRLKIKGAGYLFSTEDHEWYKYREQVISAVIEWSGSSHGTGLFNGCTNMTEVDLSGFDTSGMTTFAWMFNDCASLKKLDLSSFDLSSVNSYVGNVFTGCTSLEEIKTPRNVSNNVSIYLQDIDGRKWRKEDGTELSMLPQTGEESITITSNMVAVSVKASYGTDESGFIVKDADGKVVSMLLMQRGSKEKQTFTIEAADNNYVAGSVWLDSSTALSIMPGSQENQYIIAPKDIEQGYERDETLWVQLTPISTYNMYFQYSNAQKLKDVIVANGALWETGRPESVSISNANHTSVYLKTDDEGLEIPEIRCSGEDIAFINDTNLMNAKEKELHRQGYYIFHLGRLNMDTSVTVRLTSFKKVQFATEGFPGSVRVIRYINDGTASEPKWRSEVINGPLAVKSGSEVYFKVEWEDTPSQEYKWCSPQFTVDTQAETAGAEVTETEIQGIEGKVQLVNVPGDMTVTASLKPHTIALNYMPGDLVEIKVSSGAVLSEDGMSVGVYTGDSLTLTVKLDNGLETSSAWADDPNLSSIKNADGTYTISVKDMSKLLELTAINLRAYDPQNRISFSDLEMNVTLKFKDVRNGQNPVYTGKPIEPQMPAGIVAYYRGEDGYGKPRTVKLKEKTDYTWTCVNNTDAGEAFVVITAVPASTKYRGETGIPFTIEKAKAPNAQQKAEYVELVAGQSLYQVNLSEKFAADHMNEKDVVPVSYKILSYEKGGVLAENAVPVVEGDKLTYTLRSDADKNSEPATIIFDAAYKNYYNCQLTLTIQVVKKEIITLGGTVTAVDKVYDSMDILPDLSGLKVVSREGAAVSEAEAAELLAKVRDTIAYHYIGVGNTKYDSDRSPVDVGTYKIQARVADTNTEYKSDYFDGGTFSITQRPVTLTADDEVLYLNDTIPTEYTCSADNLAEGDTVKGTSFITCEALKTTETEGEYPIILNAAAAKIVDRTDRDVTGNYIVSGKNGTLTVRKPEAGTFTVTYKGSNPQDVDYVIIRSGIESGSLLEMPNPPSAEGLTFLGWYKDEALTKEWNFDTDIVQENITLYAGWLKAAQQGTGVAMCIQEILPQTYTGKAIKPSVTVFSEEEEGSKRLKLNKDYKVEYKNNVNADTKTFTDGEIPEGGIGENVDDTAHGFDKRLPYVIITGKGSYKGKVYVNFHIRAADISAAETAGSGFAFKYMDQLDVKDSKYGAVVKQFKYKNKSLKYSKDYVIAAQKQDNAASINSKGQILLAAGDYDVSITGKGNFTGEIRKQLYIADKSKLMKNAKITCERKVSSPTQQELQDGVLPKNLVVKLGGKTLVQDTDYTVECTNNHGIGTASVTVMAKQDSGYIGSKSITFAIKGAAFKEKALRPLNLTDKSYTGRAVTLALRGEQPELTLTTADGRALEYGKDYIVSYKNNIRKGKAVITFKALPASGYSGSFSKKFNIMPMKLDAAAANGEITITGAERTDSGWRLTESQRYRKAGAAPSGAVSLELNAAGAVLTAGKGKDYTISYTNNKAVGTGAVMTLKGTGNYEGSINISFEITKASLSQLYEEGLVTVTSKPVKANIPKRKIKVDDGDPEEGIPPEYDYELKKPDAEFKPAVTVKDGKAALRKGTDYEVEYSDNTHQDVYDGSTVSAVITGKGNYEGESFTIPVTVYTRTLSAGKVRVDYEKSYTYTGGRIMPDPSVTYIVKKAKGNPESDDYQDEETEDLTLGRDYRIVYGKNTSAGKGTIKIIGMGRYSGTVTKTFRITPKPVYNKDETDDPDETE